MFNEFFYLPSPDQQTIAVYKWTSDPPAKGIVLILHGMAEHALRYDVFAQNLNANGYDVYACDLRGHGKTGQESKSLGFFSAENGWRLVHDDIHSLIKLLKNRYGGIPLFLYGHSMGSFLARTCINLSGEYLAGVILCGTSVERVSFLKLIHALTLALSTIIGPKKPSKLLNYLTFNSFNKKFKPYRTPFDWLSRDKREVDLYYDDPLCGFVCTYGFFRDLLTGLILINQTGFLKSDFKPPLLLQAGTRDPVSHMGKDIPLLAEKYFKSGFDDVNFTLYQDARHALMHESNKQEVINDILIWLKDRTD